MAIFIVQKILLDDMGLSFVCQTYERFLAVVTVFNTMVSQLVEHQALRLLKHVIRCYYRLSDNARCVRLARRPAWPVRADMWRNGAKALVWTGPRRGRARDALRQCLPEPLRDGTFSSVLKDDTTTKRWLAQLLVNLSDTAIQHA